MDGRTRWVTAIVLAVLGALAFGPHLGALTSHFLGREYVDHYGTQWFYWFVHQQIETGGSMDHTTLFFYPYGKDIFAHTGANVLDAIVAIPFRMLLGPTLGYNAFVLVGLAATAWAFSRLAREFTDDPVAVGVSTGLFVFTPFVLMELIEGRSTQGILLLPVLFVHAAWRTGTRRGWCAPTIAAITLALSGYQYWYYAFFGGIACIGMGMAHVIRPPAGAGPWWRVLGRYAGLAVAAVALCLPVGLPLLGISGTEDMAVPGLIDTTQWSLAATPPVTMESQQVGLFLWQPLRHAAGFFVLDGRGTERFLAEAGYLPWIALPLLGAYLIRPGRLQRAPLIAMLLCVGAIAVGPFLLVDQIALPNPVFIYLLKVLTFMRRLWWPARAFAFVAIGVGIAIAVALAGLRRFGRRWQGLAAVFVTLAWAAELAAGGLVPFPIWRDTVPAGYRCLASGPPGALIELPYGWTQAHLYYQTHHGRPVFGGMIENNAVFTPTETLELQSKNTFVARLIGASHLDRNLPDLVEGDQQAIYDLGFRYIVFQKDAHFIEGKPSALLDDAIRARLRGARKVLRRMLGSPVYEDARVAIFAPWGDPVPCDATQISPDVSAMPVAIRDLPTPRQQVKQPIIRLLKAPRVGDTGGDTGGG